MTAQARRAAPSPTTPRTRSAPVAARAPGRAPNPNPKGKAAKNPAKPKAKAAKPALAIVPNPAPAKAPAKPAAEENPRRRRRSRKGRRRHNPRRRNPVASTLGILGIAVVATGVGYFGYRAYQRKHALNKPLAESLASMLKPGATLAEVPFIVADVMQPVALTTVPIAGLSGYSLVPDIVVHAPGTLSNDEPMALRNVEFGSGAMGVPNDMMWEGRKLDGEEVTGVAAEGVGQAIGSLVTNVTPDTARQIYERTLAKLAAGGEWESGHDAIIASILGQLAPSVDWSRGLAPYVRGDAASQVWSATQTIGAVASQSYSNKVAAAEG